MFGMGKKNIDVALETAEPVHFHGDLCVQLIASQSVVYADFKAISTLLADGIQSEIEFALIKFKRNFQTYLLDKNVKVFSYLKSSVDLGVHEESAVHKSRAMNNDLSRSVNRFLDVYLKEGKLELEDSQKNVFEQQLKEIGKQMANVMRDERDSLFPIYDRQGVE